MKIVKHNQKTIRIGQNRKENHVLIDDADKNDWWFHIHNKPSSHIILESDNIEQTDFDYIASIFKEMKDLRKVTMCYQQVKYLKKTKNPGEVSFTKAPFIISL